MARSHPLKLDEREQQVTGRAAWYGFCTSLLIFFALAFGYNLTGHILPWTTQLVVLAACAVTFITTVRNNGYHFRLPGILPENEVTLGQPATIRAIPWAMFVIWLAGTVVDGIPYAIQGVKTGQITTPFAIIYTLVSIALGFVFTRAIARDIRLGRGTVIRAINTFSLLNVFGLGALLVVFALNPVPEATSMGFSRFLVPGSALVPLTFLWSLWYEITLIKNRKVMEQDSEWDPKKSFWTAEYWAAKKATTFLLVISTISYLVFNTLSLLQEYSGFDAHNPWVFVPSLIGAALGGTSLIFGIALSFWQYWKQPQPMLKALTWAAVIILVNVLVAHYTPSANTLTF